MESRNSHYLYQAIDILEHAKETADKIGYPVKLDESFDDRSFEMKFFSKETSDAKEIAKIHLNYSLIKRNNIEIIEVSVSGMRWARGHFGYEFSTCYEIGSPILELPEYLASKIDEIIDSFVKKNKIKSNAGKEAQNYLQELEKKDDLPCVMAKDVTVVTTIGGAKLATYSEIIDPRGNKHVDPYRPRYITAIDLFGKYPSKYDEYKKSDLKKYAITLNSLDHLEPSTILIDLDK